MNVLVSYSRPRGKYGRLVFTVMIYSTFDTETEDINVTREQTRYSCGHCGKWATITTYEKIGPQSSRKMVVSASIVMTMSSQKIQFSSSLETVIYSFIRIQLSMWKQTRKILPLKLKLCR